MSKLETLSDWTYSDASIDGTIVMSNDRSNIRVESQAAIEKNEREIDGYYADVERALRREDDVAAAYLDVLAYAKDNMVFMFDRCTFADFRELCLSSHRKLS